MKNLVKLSLVALLTAAAIPAMAAKTEPYTNQGTNAREMLVEQPIHWISVDQLKKELEGKAPINVSFDIDDTVLFSSPCFYYGQQKYSPGKHDYLKNQDFWNEVNAGCDQYSIPKQIAVDLISMHQARGDQIYFITGRTAGDKDGVTPVLQKAFNIKDMHPVEFMGGRELSTKYNKTRALSNTKSAFTTAIAMMIFLPPKKQAFAVSASCAPPTLLTNRCQPSVVMTKKC